MRRGRFIWILLCLLCGVGAWFLWHHGSRSPAQTRKIAPTTVTTRSLSTAPLILAGKSSLTNAAKIGVVGINTNKFAYRLSNTTRSIGQLVDDRHAILLENALIDTANPLNLSIPANLRASGDPGAYIVQARGPIDNAFRAMLAQAGATVVAYIPNDAYLVRASASVAGLLGANPQTQAVIPYEPYYKVQLSLLAYGQGSLPQGAALNLGLFADDAPATIQQIERLGGQIFAQDQSPFGPVVRVQLPPALAANWTALAGLTGVQIVEPYYKRAVANDLARVTLGVSTDTITPTNYMNLTGSNIIVEVNDTGIDAQHPDFSLSGTAQGGPSGPTRVFGDAPQSLVDTNGHGTHVAGIIAGNGAESSTFASTNLPAGSVTNADFRGKAPQAILYSVGGIFGGADTNIISDQYFQEVPALTNALISNNSWGFPGDNQYDLSAASYDAAVRDALPFVTGSQPVLFVFAAGNEGAGGDDGGGGNADTISSPATGKDVITVGATEELRNITNWVTALDGSSNQIWEPQTDTSSQVAGYSSRGNVGIGIEGTFGRYKPDVVAPGTFVVSTRSEQWDTNAYYNPTNFNLTGFSDAVGPGSKNFYSLVIPPNIVGFDIQLDPNLASPVPFPTLPILVWNGTSPRTTAPFLTGAGSVTLSAPAITPVNTTWQYAVSNNTSITVNYDAFVDVITTNDNGNLFQVLDQLNESLGSSPHYYRYETGTSMATPSVSGVLALMQEFYANAYGVRPSPAMLKAMLINGARATDNNSFQVQNAMNFQGWGLVNLPAALQPGITNQLNINTPCSLFIQDQNPTNALATGDSQTYYVLVTNAQAQQQPLRVTLAWTDPPGDPAAAIKLVNNLVLVVTNFDNPTNPAIYYGNDIGSGNTFNAKHGTNDAPVFDFINNVQNVYITAPVGTNYSITVLGYRVNVNAVTAQTNNVVQDYALVISSGDGGVTNAMTVTTLPPSTVSNPTGDQQITYLSATNNNGILLNQFVGANTPLLGNNTVPLGTITVLDTNGVPIPAPGFTTNAVVTVGMTNQWHFYVVTNTFAATNSAFTNAAFVTFIPDTLSIPRLGVFADTTANATRPEADIDLYVSTDPTLTNLNPAVISNCVHGTQVGLSAAGPKFAGASLSRLGTEFVVDIGSQPSEVYYIGVKSEDQMAAEYAFLAVFSQTPFSQMNPNGSETVFGVPVPSNIPDGSPALPGIAYVIGLALQPMELDRVTVTNQIWHQNFGDLIGTFTHDATTIVLNNHDSVGNSFGLTFPYDDTPYANAPSDGPGSLNSFIGQEGIGPWILSEEDNSLTQTGKIQSAIFTLQPHQDLTKGINVFIQPGGWFYGFVDVPPGATNLTISATNITQPPDLLNPVQLFEKFGTFPTLTNFDAMVGLTNAGPLGPGGSISIGPPLTSGRYFVGLFNPGPTEQEVYIIATIGLPFVPAQTIYNSTDTPIPILDDAVTTDSINVPDNQTISAMDVAISVAHPRISDLVFHLISPDGTRVLLMENRGGTDPNGAGGVASVTINIPVVGNFDTAAATNYTAGQIVGGWTVAANQVSVQNDPVNAYPGTSNYLALANGTLSTTLTTVPGATYTLKFAYRGPDITGWWRGESNNVNIAVDSIYRNNGTMQLVTFTTGIVDQAFASVYNFNPPHSLISVQDQPIFQLTNSLSMDGWVKSVGATANAGVILWRGDCRSGYDPYFFQVNGDNTLGFTVEDATGAGTTLNTSGSLAANQWYHVAATLDGNSRIMRIYVNGVQVAQTNTVYLPFGALDPNQDPTLGIGNVGTSCWNYVPFNGSLDEISLYGRALSLSEVQAIYTDGSAGKFDRARFPLSASQSLAEAQISLNGVTTNLFGNNTTWQTYTVSFKATQTSTPLEIQGIEPGMLLDAASVTAVITNYSYLVFTENTNLTTTPIKFAAPPFAGAVSSSLVVTGTAEVWLAGMPNGSTASACYSPADTAPTESPVPVPGLRLTAGDFLTFSASGMVSTDPFPANGAGPNGSAQAIRNPTPDCAPENGLPECRAPYDSLVGVFLDNNQPNLSPAPAALDFSTQANRDYTVLAPGLKQVFFIGTGLTSFGAAHRVIVPQGATRLFLGTIDGAGWYNNSGNFAVQVAENPSDVYYLPEQSLDTFDGLDALGTWTLEIQDDRVGATNPAPALLSWQLRFNYVTTGTNANGIPPGPQTNVIQPGSWIYYPVNVPTNADTATNILLFATGPLNVWFNSVTNPIGINPPDYILITNALSGTSVLSTFSVPTNIVPGGVYYIGLYNPNPVPVTNGFEVDFHYFQVPPLTNGVPVTNIISGTLAGDGMVYRSVTVPPNADYATNILLFSTTPVNLWFNQNKPPVGLTPPDYLLIANATNGISILSAGSTPPLVPGATYYLAIQNTNGPTATNALEVDFHLYASLTNGVPTTNSVPPNNFAYYTVTVPTNADYATNLLLFATTNVNVWFNQYAPPIGLSPADSLLIANATNGVSILSATSAPPLVPGSTYYLGVQNTNATTVTFGLQVDFHLVLPVTITGPTITATNVNGTNGFLLQWSGPTNYQYTIQWKTNLAPVFLWNTVSNLVINVTYTPTNGDYSWFDDGSLTGGWSPAKFYRVLANYIAAPITNSTPTTNIVVSGTITPLTVSVPAGVIAATNMLISASGPVDVWFNQTTQPTGNTGAGDVLMLSNVTSGTFVLTGSSVPPLVPGANYYLGVQSLGTSNVSFAFQVNFGYASTNPPSISSITVTNVNGTNAILLKWVAPTNYQFQVQWATNLAPAIAWHTISNVVLTWSGVVSPTNSAYGIFQYLDDGSLTGGWGPFKFYRLVEYPYSTPIPQTLTIINTAIIGSAVQFQWVAPTNYQYQVLWTTNLGLPLASWTVLANPVLGLSNGVYTFTDTNQTGPATVPKFFRLLEH